MLWEFTRQVLIYEELQDFGRGLLNNEHSVSTAQLRVDFPLQCSDTDSLRFPLFGFPCKRNHTKVMIFRHKNFRPPY